LSQECFKAPARDVTIPDPEDAITSSFEQFRASGVVRPSVASVVRVAFQLQDEPLGHAVEVHDEAVQDVLAAELQTEHAPVAQQRPRVAFGRARCSAELAREREFPCEPDVAERIRASRVARPTFPWRTRRARDGT